MRETFKGKFNLNQPLDAGSCASLSSCPPSWKKYSEQASAVVVMVAVVTWVVVVVVLSVVDFELVT